MGLAETRVQLCGPFAVRLAGRRVESQLSSPQLRLLFAYLTLERDRPVPRGELVGAVWGDAPPPLPDTALSALLSRLRKVLGSEGIVGRSSLRVQLPEDCWVDVEAARDADHRAEAAILRQDWTDACVACDITYAIGVRELLPGLDAPWVDEQRRLLGEVYLSGREHYAEVGLALGGVELSAAQRAARQVLAAAPYRERAHALLMRALAAQGNSAEALLVYEGLRRLLRDELGTEPGAQVRALHLALLRGDHEQSGLRRE